ncbi:hypothetical protein MNBD_BACTEROID05-212, partial [hydrothermal vent metagenome]
KMKSVFGSLPTNLVHDEFAGMKDTAKQQGTPALLPDFAPKQSSAPSPAAHTGPKVGRNDPCSCGSGKKYKKCCGA